MSAQRVHRLRLAHQRRQADERPGVAVLRSRHIEPNAVGVAEVQKPPGTLVVCLLQKAERPPRGDVAAHRRLHVFDGRARL